MNRVALFGGSFNPVTKGHIEICEYLIETGLFDKVLLQPCYKSFYGKKLEKDKDRIEMLKLSINRSKYKNYIEVSTYEIYNKLNKPSLKVIEHMSNEGLINATTYFVMGYDNINKFRSWFNSLTQMKLFLSYIKIVAIPRTGYEIKDKSFPYIDIYTPKEHAKNISSTQVREDIKNKGYSNYVFPEVNKYIKKHGIYLDY